MISSQNNELGLVKIYKERVVYILDKLQTLILIIQKAVLNIIKETTTQMDMPQISRSNSVQMRAHLPEQKARKKIQRLAQIRNNQQLCTKVPVWLDITYRKEQKPFVIDPDKKFAQFRQAIKAYLMYYRQNSDKGYYYILRNQNTKFTLTNGHVQMGELYDKYKTQLGWLQIQINQDSMF